MSLHPYLGFLRIMQWSHLLSVVIRVALVSQFVVPRLDGTKLLINTLSSKTRAHRQWMASGLPRVPATRPVSLAVDGVATGDKKPGDHSARTRALAAVLVLIGIAVVGLLVGVVIVLLGHRMRRIARGTLPNQSQIDAFWYLRPKPSREGNPEEPVDAGTEDSVFGDENSDE